MKKYLLKMIDGGLINVIEDNWCESRGCDTCDYGSEYIREFTLVLEGFCLKVQLGDMYCAPYSEKELMMLLCNNTDTIANLTQDDFINFIKDEITKLYNSEKYEYEPTFKYIKDI